MPRMRRTPCDSSRLVTPSRSVSSMPRDAFAQRGDVEPAVARRAPSCFAWPSSVSSLPVATIALLGMQSQRCAAPPMTSRSISVTSAPSDAATVAAVLPAGTATDDHEAHGHDVQATRAATPPTLTNRCSELRADELTGDARDRRARRARLRPDTFRVHGRRRCRRRVADRARSVPGNEHETPPEVARIGRRRARHAGLAGARRAEHVPDRRRRRRRARTRSSCSRPRTTGRSARSRRRRPRPRCSSCCATAPRSTSTTGSCTRSAFVNHGKRGGRVDRAPARAARRARLRAAARRRDARPVRRRAAATSSPTRSTRRAPDRVHRARRRRRRVVPAGVERRRSRSGSRSRRPPALRPARPTTRSRAVADRAAATRWRRLRAVARRRRRTTSSSTPRPRDDARPFHWWVDIVPRARRARPASSSAPALGEHRRARATRPRRCATQREHRASRCVTIDAPPARGVARSSSRSNATSTGWPTRSRSRSRATQHRGVGTRVRLPHQGRTVPHDRPHDRHRVGARRARWASSTAASFTGRGRFTLRSRERGPHALHVDRGAHVPVVDGRAGRARSRPSRCCARCGARNLRRLKRLVDAGRLVASPA